MKTTIVIFRAYERINNESFIHGETLEQIHEKLNDICNTYEPLHILEAEEAEPVSLNKLNIFKTQEA